MFVHLVIHRPKTGQEQPLIESMHRFAAAIQGQPGLHEVYTLQDQQAGALVGLALWDSPESMQAARPLMAQAVQDDPFDEWEDEDPTVYTLETV
jgi:heme-degrading monooxygenase HmoA